MKKKGFTLVELLAVIIILGIIALIAIPVVNVQLVNSQRDSFKLTCNKIYEADEEYRLYEELLGTEYECIVFDFDLNIDETTIIDGIIYEPISKLGIDKSEGISGQYKICEDKVLAIGNDKFTCVFDSEEQLVVKGNYEDTDITKPELSVGVTPSFDLLTVIALATEEDGEIKNYYYKIGNGDYIKSTDSTYTFKNLEDDKNYKITVYVENETGLKSDEVVINTKTTKAYVGVPKKTYEIGETLVYDGEEFEVVSDNGDTVTLITKSNVKVGRYGTSTDWNTSEAKQYLNNDWLNSHSIIKSDVERDAITYDNDSSSYVRLIRLDELNSSLVNSSNTPFWTMTTEQNELYYALKNATTNYKRYSVSANETGTLYRGTSDNLSTISTSYTKNNLIDNMVPAKASPTSTSVVINTTYQEVASGSGKSSYTTTPTDYDYDCNCSNYACQCEDYSCYSTSSWYDTRYGSYCTGSTCTGSYCTGSTCKGSACAGSACAGSACAGSACAGSACAGSACAYWTSTGWYCGGYASTVCGSDCTGGWKSSYNYPCGGSGCTSNRYTTSCAGNKCVGSTCTGWTTTYYTNSKGQTTRSTASCKGYKCTNYSCTNYQTQTNCAGSGCTSTKTVLAGTSCLGWRTNYCEANCTRDGWYGSACSYSTCTGSTCTRSTCTGSTCTGSTCTGSACAGSACGGSKCAGYSTTVAGSDLKSSSKLSTCTTCKSTCTTCDTCTGKKNVYGASGSDVTWKRYTVSESSDVIGIRAVITVKKR